MRHVILLTDAHESPAPALLDLMRGAGISTLIEVLRDFDPPDTSDAPKQEGAGDDEEIVAPVAVLYEVGAGASMEELHSAVRQAVNGWPNVPLVACRRPASDQVRRSLHVVEGATLKRAGFRAVADDPAQLPALLRKLEELGTTGDLPVLQRTGKWLPRPDSKKGRQ